MKTRKNAGSINLIFLFLLAAAGFFLYRKFFALSFERVIPVDDLKGVVHGKDAPALVWFYSDVNKMTRVTLKSMERLAALDGVGMKFYACKVGDEEGVKYADMRYKRVVFLNGEKASVDDTWFDGGADANATYLFILYQKFLYPRLDTKPLRASDVPTLSGEELERALGNARGPVVVDFFWQECPASNELVPHFAAFAADYGGVADFYFVPYNDHTGAVYGLKEAPTVILFKGGNAVARSGTFPGTRVGCYMSLMKLIFPAVMEKARQSL